MNSSWMEWEHDGGAGLGLLILFGGLILALMIQRLQARWSKVKKEKV